MNLQSIERLQNLLARVEQNAKVPRTRTQGFGAYRAISPAPLPSAAVRVDARAEPPKEPPAVEPSLSPESLPSEALIDIDISVSPEPPLVQAAASRAELPPEDLLLDEVSAVELSSEELPIEDMSAEELGVEEITIDVTIEAPIAAQPAPSPAAAASIIPQTYTAPPALDELTFSEPPPPILAKPEARETEVEPPLASLAQAVAESPGSIDAALLLAATEAQDEAPALTPPPESGPQVAVPPMTAPAVPAAIATTVAPYRGAAPTIEQLGDVVELEPPSVVPIELAVRRSAGALAPSEELEFVPQPSEPSRKIDVREPMQTLVGGFTEEGGSGPSVHDERPAADGRVAAPLRPTAESSESAARPPAHTRPLAAEAAAFGEEAPTASSPLGPEAVVRPTRTGREPVVDVITAVRGYRPRSFAELLDASMGLLK